MTLLETAYAQLNRAGLANSAQSFSTDYLGKSKNWYAYQKHAGRDFSVDAAIQCLCRIRGQLRDPSCGNRQHNALQQLEHRLVIYLRNCHRVADVC